MFHGVSYVVKTKDKSVLFFGQVCFDKITNWGGIWHEYDSDGNIVPWMRSPHPTTADIESIKVCLNSIPVQHFFTARSCPNRAFFLSNWQKVLDRIVGKGVFELDLMNSGGSLKATFKVPKGITHLTFKFYLFLLRAPFVNPFLAYHIANFTDTDNLNDLWRAVLFLDTYPYGRNGEDPAYCYDNTHSLTNHHLIPKFRKCEEMLEILKSPNGSTVMSAINGRRSVSFIPEVKYTKSTDSINSEEYKATLMENFKLFKELYCE